MAGLGSGKTTSLAAALLSKISIPGTVAGLFAPTRKMIHKAVLKTLKQTWQTFGLMDEFDYVVNKTPPQNWGVKKMTLGNLSGIITTRWGSYVVFDGLENYDSQRGQEYDVVFIDEFRDVKDGALEVIEGRLRGKRFKDLGLPHQLFIFTTPPDDPTKLLEIIENKDTFVIEATTYSNEKNLPPNYIENLRNSMSDIEFRREVLAELIPATETPFAASFDRNYHVVDNIDFDGGMRLLSFDFNVSPAVATIWSFQRGEFGFANCIDEIRMENVSIYDVCAEIRRRYGNSGEWIVTGDASGLSRSSLSPGLATYYRIIQTELMLRPRDIVVPRSNPLHKESFAFVNAALERKKVRIHKRCVHTIKDLTVVGYSPVSGIDKKDPKLGHLLDSFRYALHYIFKNEIYKKDAV